MSIKENCRKIGESLTKRNAGKAVSAEVLVNHITLVMGPGERNIERYIGYCQELGVVDAQKDGRYKVTYKPSDDGDVKGGA